MYVTTFYSFKGGVGRTLAIVNVAAHLASQGRRVLLVDFDLEAPGLDTFDLPKPKGTNPGIVDFVTDYLNSGKAPPVQRYIYESPGIASGEGRLWVMPAGRMDGDYSARFSDINWADLYASHSGYALFEDLKKQWEKRLEPDYVLVDSRTGLTDVGGICTRQLPDAVVILFFPNEQNLRGVIRVVRQIRQEEASRENQVRLHFVMSNVPEIDDEDSVVEGFVTRCRQELQLDSLPLVIHHYPSLDLLKQSVFTLKHPNSRLTKQYRSLADLIKRDNLNDADGALIYLDRSLRDLQRSQQHVRTAALDKRLDDLLSKHSRDARILFRIAEIWRRLGKLGEAATAYDQAEIAGLRSPQLWFAQSENRLELGDERGALDAAKRLLESEDSTEYQVGFALRLLARLAPAAVPPTSDIASFDSFDAAGRFWIARQLSDSATGIQYAQRILKETLTRGVDDPKLVERIDDKIALNDLALGNFDKAYAAFNKAADSGNIADLFNVAMADWGVRGSPNPMLFGRVLELSGAAGQDRNDANFLECMALSNWVVGRQEEARRLLERSRQRILNTMSPEFSCWRYLIVSLQGFLEDLAEIEKLINGESILPCFMRKRHTAAMSAASVQG